MGHDARMAELIFTPEKRLQFLASLRESPNVTVAARAVGLSRRRVYQVYEAEPDFREEWDEAMAEGVETLEAEAERRGFHGIDKPVTFQGMITDTFKEYSDTLAIFLLKAHKPDKYRDNTRMELTGAGGGPVKLDDATAANKLAAIFNSVLATRHQDDGSDLV